MLPTLAACIKRRGVLLCFLPELHIAGSAHADMVAPLLPEYTSLGVHMLRRVPALTAPVTKHPLMDTRLTLARLLCLSTPFMFFALTCLTFAAPLQHNDYLSPRLCNS